MSTPSEPVCPTVDLNNDCIGLLRELQNRDGGWGYHSGSESRVEPTSWAMRALAGAGDAASCKEIRKKSCDYLRATQLADGSWPAAPTILTGSWVTSQACAVLATDEGSTQHVKAGLQWLCDDFPRDSSPLQRLVQKLRPGGKLSAHDDSLRGWGWTPRTASWVEPTAFALLALRAAGSQLLPANSMQRRELAVALLYDRMCPAGGWNCGNPRVYGVDGDALVLPTCWALLALQDAPEKPGRDLSLAWLESCFAAINSAGSLAVASLTLEHHGIAAPASRRSLTDWSARELAEQGTHVLAWTALALDPARTWFPPLASIHSTVAGSKT